MKKLFSAIVLFDILKYYSIFLVLGDIFFAHFVTKRERKADQRMVESVSQFLSEHVVASPAIRRHWVANLKKSLPTWAGKHFLNEQEWFKIIIDLNKFH